MDAVSSKSAPSAAISAGTALLLENGFPKKQAAWPYTHANQHLGSNATAKRDPAATTAPSEPDLGERKAEATQPGAEQGSSPEAVVEPGAALLYNSQPRLEQVGVIAEEQERPRRNISTGDVFGEVKSWFESMADESALTCASASIAPNRRSSEESTLSSSSSSSSSPLPSPPPDVSAANESVKFVHSTMENLQDQMKKEDGPKKKRTRTTPEQLRILQKAFQLDPMPTAVARAVLAKRLGMNSRAVQVWFQNRRAKGKLDKKRAEANPSAAATGGVMLPANSATPGLGGMPPPLPAAPAKAGSTALGNSYLPSSATLHPMYDPAAGALSMAEMDIVQSMALGHSSYSPSAQPQSQQQQYLWAFQQSQDAHLAYLNMISTHPASPLPPSPSGSAYYHAHLANPVDVKAHRHAHSGFMDHHPVYSYFLDSGTADGNMHLAYGPPNPLHSHTAAPTTLYAHPSSSHANYVAWMTGQQPQLQPHHYAFRGSNMFHTQVGSVGHASVQPVLSSAPTGPSQVAVPTSVTSTVALSSSAPKPPAGPISAKKEPRKDDPSTAVVEQGVAMPGSSSISEGGVGFGLNGMSMEGASMPRTSSAGAHASQAHIQHGSSAVGSYVSQLSYIPEETSEPSYYYAEEAGGSMDHLTSEEFMSTSMHSLSSTKFVQMADITPPPMSWQGTRSYSLPTAMPLQSIEPGSSGSGNLGSLSATQSGWPGYYGLEPTAPSPYDTNMFSTGRVASSMTLPVTTLALAKTAKPSSRRTSVAAKSASISPLAATEAASQPSRAKRVSPPSSSAARRRPAASVDALGLAVPMPIRAPVSTSAAQAVPFSSGTSAASSPSQKSSRSASTPSLATPSAAGFLGASPALCSSLYHLPPPPPPPSPWYELADLPSSVTTGSTMAELQSALAPYADASLSDASANPAQGEIMTPVSLVMREQTRRLSMAVSTPLPQSQSASPSSATCAFDPSLTLPLTMRELMNESGCAGARSTSPMSVSGTLLMKAVHVPATSQHPLYSPSKSILGMPAPTDNSAA